MQYLFWMTPPWTVVFFPFFLAGIFSLGSFFLPRGISLTKAQRLFLSGALGTALSQSLVLLGLPLWVSLAATLGAFAFNTARAVYTRTFSARGWNWVRFSGFAVLCAIPLLMTLGENLLGWDARAIWFFHGNLIFDAG